MVALSFPQYNFRVKNNQNNTLIFDGVRKKFVVLTPEEWVRQHVVRYLAEQKKFPMSLINVEKQLQINGLNKRYDVVVYAPDGSIDVLVETKAPQVAISQATFDQLARYNLSLNATYLMVTNGLRHYYCKMHRDLEKYEFIPEIPEFSR